MTHDTHVRVVRMYLFVRCLLSVWIHIWDICIPGTAHDVIGSSAEQTISRRVLLVLARYSLVVGCPSSRFARIGR